MKNKPTIGGITNVFSTRTTFSGGDLKTISLKSGYTVSQFLFFIVEAQIRLTRDVTTNADITFIRTGTYVDIVAGNGLFASIIMSDRGTRFEISCTFTGGIKLAWNGGTFISSDINDIATMVITNIWGVK
ncbi:MAG: hypothetical protein NC218_02450 [Acetobacter sp.]|nr:hypothetical protein [Acetobacter sp.]